MAAITSIVSSVIFLYTIFMGRKDKPYQYKKIIDNIIKVPEKQGNGTLKYSLSVDAKGKVGRYSLAYINPNLCHLDNWRVLGYDNCHGYHHRHYMGKEEAIKFISYEAIVELFEKEWRRIHESLKD